MAPSIGYLVTQSTTLLLVVFGALVLAVRPRTRASVAFGIYAIAAGVGIFASNLWQVMPVPTSLWTTAAVLKLISGAALVVLLTVFPHPVGRKEQLWIWVGSLFVLGYAFWERTQRGADIPGGLASTPIAIFAPSIFGAIYLGIRFRLESDQRTRSQIAFLSAGIIPFVAVFVGDGLLDGEWSSTVPTAVILTVATGLWLWNASLFAESSQLARNVGLLIPATLLVGMLGRLWIGEGRIDDTGVYGISRIFAFAVLSYAIVRYQFLGIDVKIRWTLSKSTVAGLFIAVFFVASEAAQQFFGDALSSQYAGIVAAGALVFAIAPLSRMADRLAARAIPLGPDGGRGIDAAAATYARQVKIAWSDAKLGSKEKRMLRDLRDALGIPVTLADQIEEEVERQPRNER